MGKAGLDEDFVDDFGDTPRKFEETMRKISGSSEKKTNDSRGSSKDPQIPKEEQWPLPLPNETFPQYNERIKNGSSASTKPSKNMTEAPKVIETYPEELFGDDEKAGASKRKDRRKAFLRERKKKSKTLHDEASKRTQRYFAPPVTEPALITVRPRKVLKDHIESRITSAHLKKLRQPKKPLDFIGDKKRKK